MCSVLPIYRLPQLLLLVLLVLLPRLSRYIEDQSGKTELADGKLVNFLLQIASFEEMISDWLTRNLVQLLRESNG